MFYRHYVYIYTYICLVVLEHDFFHLLGMSSSELTFIFFRGVETANQYIYVHLYKYICIYAYNDPYDKTK